MFSKIPAFIISLDDDESRKATDKCLTSIRETKSPIIPFVFPAIKGFEAESLARSYGLEYTYPTGVKQTIGGLELSPYKTKDLRKRIACFMSHFMIWHMIARSFDGFEYAIILEQDALFTNKFDKEYFDDVVEIEFICSLNSPIKATRLASKYDRALKAAHEDENHGIDVDFGEETEEENEFFEIIQEETDELPEIKHFEAPWIDKEEIPQGLPGNSAYIITPAAARQLIDMTNQIGIWPNDALMCKQLLPDILWSAYPYYTKVQGNKSTTST